MQGRLLTFSVERRRHDARSDDAATFGASSRAAVSISRTYDDGSGKSGQFRCCATPRPILQRAAVVSTLQRNSGFPSNARPRSVQADVVSTRREAEVRRRSVMHAGISCDGGSASLNNDKVERVGATARTLPRPSGVLGCWSELPAWNSLPNYIRHPTSSIDCLGVHLKRTCSRDTSASGALAVLTIMLYTNPRRRGRMERVRGEENEGNPPPPEVPSNF